MNSKLFNSVIAILASTLLVLFSSAFIVKEGQTSITMRLGQIKQVDLKPGLHFKLPIVDTAIKLDTRLQTLNANPVNVLTFEKKELIVDYFVEWRIKDSKLYYISTNGGTIDQGNSIISPIVATAVADEFSKRTVNQVIDKDRSQIMITITDNLAKKVAEEGIDVVDVRVKRVEFAENIKNSVFQRMRSERKRVSDELRAKGKEEAATLSANADREAQIIIANAHRDAEIARGEGEAQATTIYAKAFNKDKDFYFFQRSLEAYEQSFSDKSDVIVTSPDSTFFDYLKSAEIKAKPSK